MAGVAGNKLGIDQKIINEITGVKAEIGLESGLYKGVYSSSLEDTEREPDSGPGNAAGANVSNDLLLGLLHPMLKGSLLPLYRGLEVILRFETPACIYQGRAEVTRSAGNSVIPLLWVRPIAPLQRVQRRRFVRVPCKIKARAYLLDLNVLDSDGRQGGNIEEITPEDQALLDKKTWFPVQLKDISLGGVGGIVSHKESCFCKFGARYLLQMSIAENIFLLATNMVKLLDVNKNSNKSDLSIGLSYEGLPVCVEKLMGNFIRQQELAQKQKQKD